MSGMVVGWAFKQNTGAPAAKLVLVKLADNANEQGFCFTSIEKLVEHTELGQSTVYKHMAALEATGLVRPVKGVHPEHGYPIDGYQLAVPEEWQAIPPRGKGKGKIPPGGKHIPAHGNGIPPAGKEIPPRGMHIEEPSSEPSIEPSSEQDAASPPGLAADLFGDPILPVLSKAQVIEQALAAYDEAAARNGWAECQARTETRRKKLGQRLDDAGGLDGWKSALEKAEASDFCMGRAPPRPGHPPFKMDIDFLLQQQSFVRLMEGKYDNREGTGDPNGTGGGYLAAAARRAAANPY